MTPNPSTATNMPAYRLSNEDIAQLVREPSPAVRASIADKICGGFNSGEYSASEIQLANEIFRLLVRDSEIRVRKTLAEQLKSNLQVPRDIIWALANDRHAEVAVPVLEHSFVLSEEDLIAIVRATRELPKLRAIARRESVSRPLAHALIETRHHEVAKDVLANQSAQLSEATLDLVLEEFAKDGNVLEQMVYRGGLPIAFAERLFSAVSDTMKKQLTRKYRLNLSVVDEVSEHAREAATLQFLSPWMSQQDIIKLVDTMHKNKRLTHSVIIRSLCIGDLRFFESAIAKLVGIPVSNARILVLDPGPLGFKALYESAGMPKEFFPAIKIMLRVALEETEYGTYRATNFRQRMVERITSAGYDKDVEYMATLLSMIGNASNDRSLIH